jgi:hypothetical protein
VKGHGRQAKIKARIPEAHLVFQAKEGGVTIRETTVILNEYLRNHTKPLVSWSSV